MDLDAMLHHYFGSDEPGGLDAARLEDGKYRLTIDFGTEQEPGRRFALWTLMDALGIAPAPADAFPKDPGLKRAAEDFLSTAWRMEQREDEDED